MGPIDQVRQKGLSCDQVSVAGAGRDGGEERLGGLPYKVQAVRFQKVKSSCELVSIWDWHLDFKRLQFILQERH